MKYPTLQNIVLIIALFWFALQPATDPDTGWHLATGRFILQNHQIPQTDPFSYSLPNHPYIAHSWMADIVLYLIMVASGPLGLSILYALITTAILVLIAKTATLIWPNQNLLPFTPLIAYPVIEIIGQRPQAISVLGMSIMIYHLLNWQDKTKFNWLPFLFLIWANLHAGVILGISIFLAWIIIEIVTAKSLAPVLPKLRIWALCLAATLINPYFYRIYTFTLGMITNQTAAIYNSDWVPLFSPYLDPSSLGLRIAIVLASLVALVDNPLPRALRLISLGWLIMSFKSLRYLVPLLSSISPLVLLTVRRLAGQFNQKPWLALASLAIVGTLFYKPLVDKTDLSCSREHGCYAKLAGMPYGAVEFIKANNLSGNIFNLYTWGGYLTWQLSDSKVFIDGRMDNFFIGNTSFLEEFVSIHQQQSDWYQKIINYRTNLVLIPADWHDLISGLEHENWSVLYKDDSSILIQKPYP